MKFLKFELKWYYSFAYMLINMIFAFLNFDVMKSTFKYVLYSILPISTVLSFFFINELFSLVPKKLKLQYTLIKPIRI